MVYAENVVRSEFSHGVLDSTWRCREGQGLQDTGGLDSGHIRRVGGHVSIDSGASQGLTRRRRGASLSSNENADTKNRG
jgi:hypothetical protein